MSSTLPSLAGLPRPTDPGAGKPRFQDSQTWVILGLARALPVSAPLHPTDPSGAWHGGAKPGFWSLMNLLYSGLNPSELCDLGLVPRPPRDLALFSAKWVASVRWENVCRGLDPVPGQQPDGGRSCRCSLGGRGPLAPQGTGFWLCSPGRSSGEVVPSIILPPLALRDLCLPPLSLGVTRTSSGRLRKLGDPTGPGKWLVQPWPPSSVWGGRDCPLAQKRLSRRRPAWAGGVEGPRVRPLHLGAPGPVCRFSWPGVSGLPDLTPGGPSPEPTLCLVVTCSGQAQGLEDVGAQRGKELHPPGNDSSALTTGWGQTLGRTGSGTWW